MRFIIILSLTIAFFANSETIGDKKSSQSAARVRQEQSTQQHFYKSKKTITRTPAQKAPLTKPVRSRITYDYAFFFGDDTDFNGNPVTFSAHPDSINVRLDSNGKPFIDNNNNGIFDQDTEWGWAHGINRLDMILWCDSVPVSPPCPGLQYEGDIHVNGSIDFEDHPHFNGKGTAVGTITQGGGAPFVNEDNKYFRFGHTEYVDPIPIINIPTNLGYWHARSLQDTVIHIITDDNVDLFPGWILNGEIEGVPVFVWEGTEPIPNGFFFLNGHVRIEGNPTGNTYIITDHTIRVSGIPIDFDVGDQIKYIAGGNILVSGGQYTQGFLYTKGKIKFLGQSYIFGIIYSKEGGDISGSPIVIASKVSLPITESIAFDIKPGSCPNPLNTKSKGVLPTAILGTINFDVTTLDTSTLRLNGISPLRYNTEDVATPIGEGSDSCDCTDEGPDGFLDLTLKFRTQEIVEAIGEVEDGDTVVLTLTGNLIDGTFIEGRDCIVILEKGKEKAIASEELQKPKVYALF
jgi:hypothetical protein